MGMFSFLQKRVVILCTNKYQQLVGYLQNRDTYSNNITNQYISVMKCVLKLIIDISPKIFLK